MGAVKFVTHGYPVTFPSCPRRARSLPAPHQPAVAQQEPGSGQSLPVEEGWPRDHGGTQWHEFVAGLVASEHAGRGVSMTGSHTSCRGGHRTCFHPPTRHSAVAAVVAVGVSPVGHPPHQGQAGTERVWWHCWGQGGCARMGHKQRHSLSFPLWQFHPEDTVRTCPCCLALLAMTPLL